MRLGIDFGTTRTVVAACDRGNFPVLSFLGNQGETHEYFPSVVAEREGELRFGFQALACRGQPGWTLCHSFKRWLSSPESTPDRRIRVGGTELELSTLLARYLEALREALFESDPRLRRARGPLAVTVATPAGAFSTQRLVTLAAFRRAGFDVVSMLDEPSAAGVEYAHRYRNTFNSRREKVLVYDLGGGTFDVSLVDMKGDSHDVISSHGLSRLGGDDFDEALLGLALEGAGIGRRQVEPSGLAELLLHCRELKEAIHANSKKIFVDLSRLGDAATLAALGLASDASSVVTVAQYERACEPLLDKTLELVGRTLARGQGPSQADLDANGESALRDVAGLYVVGGASALPTVARRLRTLYGRRVRRSPYPSAAIAIGLAIAADEGAPYELKHRFHHHLGVFREVHDGRSIAFDRIIGPGTALPETGVGVVNLCRRYRAKHNVGHYRFVECGWLDESGQPSGDIKPFGDVLFPFDSNLRELDDLREVPVCRTGAGPEIEEIYQISEYGTVELTIVNRDAGYEQHYRIAG